ncbi:reverse transcriptase domain-containing protein, partial [Tanacetum coccineum]
PPSPIRSLGYRAATIRMRAEAAATSHSLPLPPPFILQGATRLTRAPPVTPTPNETTTTVTEAQLQALIDQGVAAAMAEVEASRVRNGYNSNGTEGGVEHTRWFEKMESVFSISNCTTSCQVKFVTCTLQDDALTWWNAHVKTTTPEASNAMPWATLKKMMIDKYCPRGEIKKIKTEMWNLKETDIQEKDEKQSKNDQTKHGIEKTKSNRSQSQSKSESQPKQSQKLTK